jgi:hypothetical protein
MERDHLEDVAVDGRMILISFCHLHLGLPSGPLEAWRFKKWDGDSWTGMLWLRTGTVGGHLSHR